MAHAVAKIQAVIFDLDGVIIDSEGIWQEAESTVFNGIGIPVTREMAKQTMGLRVDEVVRHWFARYAGEYPEEKDVAQRIQEAVIALIREKGKSLPGVQKTVQDVSARGIPLAIASSSSRAIIAASLGKLDLEKYFKVICSAETEPFGKPHPQVYLRCSEKLGVAQQHCLVFEDSINGVIAAKAARMFCVAVPNHHLTDTSGFCIADRTIPSLEKFSIEEFA